MAGAAPAQRRCDRRAPAALVTGAALAGTDLLDWIALRRVSDGGVTNLDGCWLDGGRRVPGYVTETLGELLAAGLIVLADQQPVACAGRRSPTAGPRGTSDSRSNDRQYLMT
ncbi:MAG: hypothetical protein ACRDQY_23025 [Pseudonocardiaceae bacterium]